MPTPTCGCARAASGSARCTSCAATPFVRSCWADALSAGVGDEQRRDAAFWAALWRLARSARPDHRRAGLPPAVSTVVRTIEDNLDRPLPVAELAAAAGVSHNHLTRLFGSHLGTTVVGYVRRRRLEEAEHLLRNSTMPVARIARMVGIRTCRRSTRPAAGRSGKHHGRYGTPTVVTVRRREAPQRASECAGSGRCTPRGR